MTALAPPNKPLVEEALNLLTRRGELWWFRGDGGTLLKLCSAFDEKNLARWPAVAQWRALVGTLQERSDVFECLEAAYQGYTATDQLFEAAVVAHTALTMFLVDIGGLKGLDTWVSRTNLPLDARAETCSEMDKLWLVLGHVARAVLETKFSACVFQPIVDGISG
jgi:hypothetical protein